MTLLTHCRWGLGRLWDRNEWAFLCLSRYAHHVCLCGHELEVRAETDWPEMKDHWLVCAVRAGVDWRAPHYLLLSHYNSITPTFPEQLIEEACMHMPPPLCSIKVEFWGTVLARQSLRGTVQLPTLGYYFVAFSCLCMSIHLSLMNFESFLVFFSTTFFHSAVILLATCISVKNTVEWLYGCSKTTLFFKKSFSSALSGVSNRGLFRLSLFNVSFYCSPSRGC